MTYLKILNIEGRAAKTVFAWQDQLGVTEPIRWHKKKKNNLENQERLDRENEMWVSTQDSRRVYLIQKVSTSKGLLKSTLEPKAYVCDIQGNHQ